MYGAACVLWDALHAQRLSSSMCMLSSGGICRKSVNPIPTSQTWQDKLRCESKQLPLCLHCAVAIIPVSVMRSHAQNMRDTATALHMSVTAGV